ncbi:MAG: hypothetical protein ACREVJ_02985 [Gammaproteobacteria bacterium]
MPLTLLDSSRPFGEVYGEAAWRYEQEGKRFDSQGREIEPDVGDALGSAPTPEHEMQHDERVPKQKRRGR